MRILARFGWIALMTCALADHSADEIQTKEICPGVRYESITRKSIPLKIHVLSVDLRQPNLEIVVRASRGLKKLTELAAEEEKKGHAVVGGMNGDYFFEWNTQPLGIEIVDGILKKPPNIRAALLVNDKRTPYIGVAAMQAELTLPNGETFKPDLTNQWARRGQSALYTIRTPTEWEPPEGSTCAWLTTTEPITTSKPFTVKVQKLRKDPAWISLNEDQLFLVEPTATAKILTGKVKEGDLLKVSLSLKDANGTILQAISGGPRVVRDGKKSVENEAEKMDGHQVFGKNPRVGVGYTKDGNTLKLFAVDGRQAESIGLDMAGLADIMLEQDIYQGLALDGGGSTTLIAGTDPDFEKRLMTKAVGAGVHDKERRIANAILILQKGAAPASKTPSAKP